MNARARSRRRRTVELAFRSDLAHPADEVWATISTMAGVNAELGPYVRMTHPRSMPAITDVEIVPGKVLFHSWVLLFGVVPFDRHAFAFEGVTIGRGIRRGVDVLAASELAARAHARRRVPAAVAWCRIT